MAQPRRSLFYLPLTLILFSLLGGLFGPGLAPTAAATSDDDIRQSVETFTKVLSVLEENTAEPIDTDKAIYNGAISSMLRTLDPHSSFFDPKLFQVLQEEQRGQYFGVGMLVGARDGGVVVVYPFSNSPAFQGGIHPGDMIIAVDGTPTVKATTSDVADLLKGPRGTTVQVTVRRRGATAPLRFTLVRNSIPRATVQNAFRIRPKIGYVHIESFNENTSREFEESLRELDESTLEGLVLDMRSNPGGLLREGVAIADRFLRKGQLIVSHRGRASAERPYVAKRGNNGREYPLVVLVDRTSASAAEIVAGALQDHDRAWIVGEPTFGKGLVQSQYPLSSNTALLLTTAKYYTPSGRLIQRDYSNRSFFEYYAHKDLTERDPKDMKATDSGRPVYGGGGITPDEEYTREKLNAFQTALLRRNAFANYTAQYFSSRKTELPANWTPGQETEDDFHQFLLKEGVSFTEADFAANHEWIRQRLQVDMYLTAKGKDSADRLSIEIDQQVAQAIDSMPKAKALIEAAKGILAKRGAARSSVSP